LNSQTETFQHLAYRALQISLGKNYTHPNGTSLNLKPEIDRALRSKVSIPPTQKLPLIPDTPQVETRISVTEETTLQASHRLFIEEEMPLALNFANGLQPGGGFHLGANAQEEGLCRCSALYRTLHRDPMYTAHQIQENYDSSDWAILSPEVPVFAREDGSLEPYPWPLGILTCAAPVASEETQDHTAKLMESRIDRILHIAVQYGYGSLVLGAWGCGAFGNDPHRIAKVFHEALSGRFAGQFDQIVFAIADPTPRSECYTAFRDCFGEGLTKVIAINNRQ
jgi:uncharacterized protein (TIGR02452 family)